MSRSRPAATAPPVDWREYADGLDRLARALTAAYGAHDDAVLIDYLPIGHELIRVGLADAAAGLASVLLREIAGPPAQHRVTLDQPTDWISFDLLANSVLADSTASTLRAGTYLLVADLYRSKQRFADAVGFAQRSATMYDELADADSSARALQTLGALYLETGDLNRADEVSERAATVFESLGNARSLLEVRLNQVQYAISAGRLDNAESRLRELAPTQQQAHDGHLSASFRRYQAMLAIKRGETEQARKHLLAALRSCRRRSDHDLELVLLQNLAKLTEETRGVEASVGWWRKATAAALRNNDLKWAESNTRSLAAALIQADKFDEAVTLFGSAERLNDLLGDHRESVRSRADMGAAQLSQALATSTVASPPDQSASDMSDIDAEADTRRRSRLLAAEQTLRDCLYELDEMADWEWAVRVAENLRLAWIALGRAADGAQLTDDLAHSRTRAQPGYAAALFNLAARLSLAAGQDPEWAAARFRLAAGLNDQPAPAHAWELARGASEIAAAEPTSQLALDLYDEALDLVRDTEDLASYGELLNDSALVLANLERPVEAADRVTQANELAETTQNRVLAALAQLNLGELNLRRGEDAAGRQHLMRCADLSAQIGDQEQAAQAWASIAGSYLTGEDDDLVAAREAATRASEFATQSRSEHTIARATSMWASIAYEEGNYPHAIELWTDAALRTSGERTAAYQAFILDAVAQLGDWRRYSRQLDRFARQSQKSGTQLEFADELWTAVGTWMRQGSPHRAARTLAYALALAADGYLRPGDSQVDLLAEYPTSRRRKVATVLVAARTYLDSSTFPPATRQALRRQLAKELDRLGGPGTSEALLGTVHEFGETGSS